jgi:putative oxidoreductase
MSNPIQGATTVLGRLMLCTIFFMSAVGNKIPNFAGVAEYMQSAGVPAPPLLLVLAIAFLLVGSVCVILGFKARLGAGLLLVFLTLATYYFHAFWNFEGQEQQLQLIQFMKNLSMAGAMLLIMANGPGPVAFDTRAAAKSSAQFGTKSLTSELESVTN